MSEDFIEVRHYALWTALDDIAMQMGISVSALAVEASLSSVTLNKSRRSSDDRLHWPSAETLAAILTATDTSWGEFGHLVDLIERARLNQSDAAAALAMVRA
jgi:transcriptional regulator with XRE-family HTH domain